MVAGSSPAGVAILTARADINARARACYERGDYAGAHAIEAEATPDYPELERDQAYMRGQG